MAMQMEAPAEGEVVEWEEGMTEGHSGPVPLQTLEARTSRDPDVFSNNRGTRIFCLLPTSSFLFRRQMAESSPVCCTRAGARRRGE